MRRRSPRGSKGRPLKVVFATRRLEACFADAELAIRTWGPVVGRRYVQRIQMLKQMKPTEIYASASLRAHALRGVKAGRVAITLHDRWRMELTLGGDILRVEEVSNHYGD